MNIVDSDLRNAADGTQDFIYVEQRVRNECGGCILLSGSSTSSTTSRDTCRKNTCKPSSYLYCQEHFDSAAIEMVEKLAKIKAILPIRAMLMSMTVDELERIKKGLLFKDRRECVTLDCKNISSPGRVVCSECIARI